MQTQCPKCATLFRITENQLQIAMGIVRCGQCQHVFNATHHQIPDESDLERAINKDNPPDEDDEPKEILRRALSLNTTPREPRIIALWSLGILFTGLVLIAQIGYWQRNSLVQHPLLRPYIEQACARIASCELAPKRNVEKLELVSRNIYTHPNIKGALMINTVIINKADFAQPYPLLLVSMSNVRGQIVAQRYFKPSEYLPEQHDAADFQSNATLTVNLEIADPGNDAIAFELDFL